MNIATIARTSSVTSLWSSITTVRDSWSFKSLHKSTTVAVIGDWVMM